MLRICIGAAVLALAAPVLAQTGATPADEPTAWLVKMSEAAREVNYQGVVIYRGDDLLETFRVTHRYQNGVERERVHSLTGEPREVEKQGDQLICLLPKTRRATAERPTPKGLFPGLTAERVQQVAQVYQFDNLGEARVAGRVCRGIAITPRDDFRYGYEVWADAQSAVPLKVNLIGRDGALLEQMMFTEVEFPGSIPDSAFVTPAPVRGESTKLAPAAPDSAPVPTPVAAVFGGQLPPGFRVIQRDVRNMPGKGMVEHWLLSDGLSAISVFTTRREAPTRGFQGFKPIGALNAYGRVSGSMHITVVGEVPQQTVKMVGDGLKLGEPAPEGD